MFGDGLFQPVGLFLGEREADGFRFHLGRPGETGASVPGRPAIDRAVAEIAPASDYWSRSDLEPAARPPDPVGAERAGPEWGGAARFGSARAGPDPGGSVRGACARGGWLFTGGLDCAGPDLDCGARLGSVRAGPNLGGSVRGACTRGGWLFTAARP